jgi:4'-phosphopantetheinyl transferase
MNIEPSQLQFCYSPHGKPALADADTTGMLQFNLSHSGEIALYAVACERQIGIDIERLRPFSELEQIAKRFFSNREYEELRALSPSQQHDAFFRYWTLKEAYVKATGQGLSLALNQFGGIAGIRRVGSCIKDPSRFTRSFPLVAKGTKSWTWLCGSYCCRRR